MCVAVVGAPEIPQTPTGHRALLRAVAARVGAREREAVVVDPVERTRRGEPRRPSGAYPARAETRRARRNGQHPITGAEVAQIAVRHRAHTAVDAREGASHAERAMTECALQFPATVRDFSDVVGLEANAAFRRAAA